MNARRSLRRQIIVSFVGFAAAVSLLFALSSFFVAYVIEDAIFEDVIAEEVARQQIAWRKTGALALVRDHRISVHESEDTFPSDLKREFGRLGLNEEYSGDQGRHYHVAAFRLGSQRQAYVVAEVGSSLAVRPMRSDLLRLVGFISLAILLVAAGLGYWLASHATAPLRRLVEKVADGTSGELPVVSAADFPPNEIGVLAGTIEAMLQRTRAFLEREARFTRDASHELRTPIAVIKTSAELLESRLDVPPTLAKPIARISKAVNQMEQSVNLLLLLAREEKAKSAVQQTPLLPLIEDILLAESVRVPENRPSVIVGVPANCVIAISERVAATLLGNLIANALNHAEGAPIEITTEGFDVVIADKGPGTPEHVLRSVLANGAPQSGWAGSGLGLSIVERLCRLHRIPFRLENSTAGGTIARLGLLQQEGVSRIRQKS